MRDSESSMIGGLVGGSLTFLLYAPKSNSRNSRECPRQIAVGSMRIVPVRAAGFPASITVAVYRIFRCFFLALWFFAKTGLCPSLGSQLLQMSTQPHYCRLLKPTPWLLCLLGVFEGPFQTPGTGLGEKPHSTRKYGTRQLLKYPDIEKITWRRESLVIRHGHARDCDSLRVNCC